MKKNRTCKTVLTSAALAGIISGSVAIKTTAAPPQSGEILLASSGETHSCAGRNSCKGKGGCKTGDNGCNGKNSCKGKGGCATPAAKPDATPKSKPSSTPTASDKLDEAKKHQDKGADAPIMQFRKKMEENKKMGEAVDEAIKKLDEQQKPK